MRACRFELIWAQVILGDFDMPESMHSQRCHTHQGEHVNNIFQWERVEPEPPPTAIFTFRIKETLTATMQF